eukprot:gene56944-biopygen61147
MAAKRSGSTQVRSTFRIHNGIIVATHCDHNETTAESFRPALPAPDEQQPIAATRQAQRHAVRRAAAVYATNLRRDAGWSGSALLRTSPCTRASGHNARGDAGAVDLAARLMLLRAALCPRPHPQGWGAWALPTTRVATTTASRAGGLGEEFFATNGILQGCPLSGAALNALVAVWAKAVAAEVPDAETDAYADDTYITSHGENASFEAVEKGHALTVKFADLTGQKLHPTKSISFSSEKRKGRGLAIGGVQLPWESTVTSLGAPLNLTKQKRRKTGPLEARAQKAQAMARRVEHVPLPFRVRSAIAAAAPVPRGIWGCETHELAKSREVRFRANVTRGIWGSHHRKRCPEIVHTLLTPGHRTDPHQAALFRRVIALSSRLAQRPQMLAKVRVAWECDHDPQVDGPVGRVRNALRELGWSWPSAETLKTEAGVEFDMRVARSGRLAHELREALRHTMWRQAAKRRPKDMEGLERGLDRNATMALLNSRELTALLQGYLRVILAGAVWTQDRLQRCAVVPSAICEYCTMEEVEDQKHRYWRCPAWRHVRERHRAATALYRTDWPKCLQCCGLMPEDMTGDFDAGFEEDYTADRHAPEIMQVDANEQPPGVGVSPTPGKEQQHDSRVETIVEGHVVVWTDGAATNNQHWELRRGGYGAFWGTRHSANISEALPGEYPGEQSNNRAELMAVLCVLKREAERAIEIRTDSQYVYDGCLLRRPVWRENKWRRKMGSPVAIDHADLWQELDAMWEARAKGPGPPRLTKVKGHAKLEDVAQGRVQPIDRWGNDSADFLATRGAAKHAVDPDAWRRRLTVCSRSKPDYHEPLGGNGGIAPPRWCGPLRAFLFMSDSGPLWLRAARYAAPPTCKMFRRGAPIRAA